MNTSHLLLASLVVFGCRGQEPDPPATATETQTESPQAVDAGAEGTTSGASTCMEAVDAWCDCRQRVIAESGLDERAASGIIRGIEMNRTAAQRSDEHCQKVLSKLPPDGPCAVGEGGADTTDGSTTTASTGNPGCTSDDECVLSRIVPDGDLKCCNGCSQRAITASAHEALRATCAKEGPPETGCPKKKCVPRKHAAKCVSGRCERTTE